ncbi:glycoside hydrolase family 61 protein [Rhizoctonia solani AG-3 Rhs1AP]|nr:glycoside hydrolase family 61 protein [Rhizoctonia solani AG-3 Rhs1AP]
MIRFSTQLAAPFIATTQEGRALVSKPSISLREMKSQPTGPSELMLRVRLLYIWLHALPQVAQASIPQASFGTQFKIAEKGLIGGTAGHYLIRWETLTLHQSNTPQFYPECARLQATGGGSASPTGEYLVKILGAWKASDLGVTIDVRYLASIYSSAAQTQTNYTIPGPRVYPGFS